MVLTRAFACALPVVASDIPGLPRGADARGCRRGPAGRSRRARRRGRRPRGRRAAPGADGRGGAGARRRAVLLAAIAQRLEEIYARSSTGRAPRREQRERLRWSQEPLAARLRRARRSSSARSLAIWWRGPDWGAGLGRVRRRRRGAGSSSRPHQLPLDRRALDLVEADDRPGAAGAAPPLPRTSSPRSASGCSGTPSCPRGRASSRAWPCCAAGCPTTGGDERDARRHRLRASALRPARGRAARPLRPARRRRSRTGRSRASSIFGLVGPRSSRSPCSRAPASRPAHALARRLGSVRRLVAMARQGLGVLRAPLPAAAAILCQLLGWMLQLLAVWTVMKAFGLGTPFRRPPSCCCS